LAYFIWILNVGEVWVKKGSHCEGMFAQNTRAKKDGTNVLLFVPGGQ